MTEPQDNSQPAIDRRSLLLGGSVAAAGALAGGAATRMLRQSAAVFVARNQSYAQNLIPTIRDGLLAVGLKPEAVAKRRVLLKPNLVEPTRTAPHVTTHPSMVIATAEVLRQWNADVVVGEGPGHVRDTELVLEASGLGEALDDAKIPFADLNYEETAWTPNKGNASPLEGFHFPRSVVEADLVISMPKMKTHHWVGVTASMKNLYGVIPGIRYGWPKNVLHFGGIPQTVFDINASLPPVMAIVDGIECMEGDGPIMGSMKPMGLVLVGANATAVDATVCRLMDVTPGDIDYLKLAAQKLGPIDDKLIVQRGEKWEPLSQRFQIIDKPHLRRFHASRGVLAT